MLVTKRYSLITAVLPGATDHLVECGQSICQQEFLSPWGAEWLVWVDGTKEEADEIEALIMADSTIKAAVRDKVILKVGFSTRHTGTAVCRNLALASASGEYVRQVDADDMLVGGALSADIKVMDGYRSRVYCASGTLNLYEDGSLHTWEGTPPEGIMRQRELYDMWSKNSGILEIYTGSVCARTDAVRVAGGWMGIWPNEDTGLLLMLSELGEGHYRKVPTMVYRFWDKASTSDFFAGEDLFSNPAFVNSAEALRSVIEAKREYARKNGPNYRYVRDER